MNVYQLTEDTSFERIRMHILEGREISEHDQEILRRWEAAHAAMMDSRESDRQVAKKLAELYGISLMQGYRDITNARNLFGDVRTAKKEGLRYLVTQWSIELFNKAEVAKDYKAMAKALERITKANNLDKEDMDIPDPSKIQPPVQLLSISFNFIDSEYFKHIDKKAQDELLKLREQIQALIDRSPVKNYMDLMLKQAEDAKVIEDGH